MFKNIIGCSGIIWDPNTVMTKMSRAFVICTLSVFLLFSDGDARRNQNRPPGQQNGPQQGQRPPQGQLPQGVPPGPPQQGQQPPQGVPPGPPQQGQRPPQEGPPGQPPHDRSRPGPPPEQPPQDRSRPGPPPEQPLRSPQGQPQVAAPRTGQQQPQPQQTQPGQRAQNDNRPPASNPFETRYQRPPPPGRPDHQPISPSNFERSNELRQSEKNPINPEVVESAMAPAAIDFYGGGIPPDINDEMIPAAGFKPPGSPSITMTEEEMEEKVGDMVYEMLEVVAEEQHGHHGSSDSRLVVSTFGITLSAVLLSNVIILALQCP